MKGIKYPEGNFEVPERSFSELSPVLLSVSADNSFTGNVSTPRGVMHSNHIASRPSLVSPDKKQSVISGIEYELGKGIDDVRTEKDCIVKGTIEKIQGRPSINPETTIFVEYEDEHGELWLDLIVVPNHKTNHSYFGYEITPTEEMQNIRYNTPLAKDTVLGKTTSLADDGFYKYGVNANIAFMSHPATAEDGFAVRRGFLEKLRYTTMEKRVIYLDHNTIPVNLYGDEDNFKMYPDIGERVRDDRILFATRKRDDFLSISDMNNVDIGQVDYNFDDLIYVEGDSVVMDVKVIKGNNSRDIYSENMTTQIDRDYQTCLTYSENIVRRYHGIIKGIRSNYSPNLKINLTPRLIRTVANHDEFVETANCRRKLSYQLKPIDQYRIEITTMAVMTPYCKDKLTDMYAGKGVICAVIEDEDMPTDELGNVADIITDGLSATISRMNIPRTYSAYFGAYARDNRQRLIDRLTEKYGKNYLNKLNDDDLIEIGGYLRDMYRLVNPKMVEFMDGLDMNGLEEHVYECLEDWIYLWYNTDNEYEVTEVIRCIEQTEYRPHYGKVTYRDARGEMVTTTEDVRIGRDYYMILDRTGRDFSAVSSAKVNGFIVPIKGGEYDKHRYPHSTTPVTNLSETESRIIGGLAGPTLLAELMDFALSPNSHRRMVHHQLTSDKLFDPDYSLDRTLVPYGSARPLRMLLNVFRASGLVLEYQKDDVVNEE